MKEMKVMRGRRRRSSNRRKHQGNRLWPVVLMTFCAILIVGSVCVLCFKFFINTEVQATSQPVVQPSVIENEQTTSLIIKVGEVHILTAAVADKDIDTLEFTTSDSEVLAVDSGGRIDALKEGEATITATGEDFFGECRVTVNKAEENTTDAEYTTAYVANLDIVEKNKEDNSQNLYRVTVNRRTNTVTVYTYDENGDYVVPVRAMVCSCGEMTEENITPTGTYGVYFKNYWHALFGDVYGKYVTGFSGHYLFHSVPYTNTESYTLKTEEFNKLGTNASQGCVRLMIADAKWIYDNLDMDTVVEVIDESKESDPLGTPPTIKVDTSIGWDPTDPHKNNPYLEKFPVISGAEDVTIEKNSDYDAKVTAVDTCSNDITDKLTVVGNVVTSKAGTYRVTYSVTDDMGKTAEKTITVTVE